MEMVKERAAKNDSMQYFDISMLNANEEFAKSLGFKKIFKIGKEISIFPNGEKCIAYISEKNFHKAVKSAEALGIVANAFPPQKKELEIIKEEEKVLIFPIGYILGMKGMELIRAIAQLKNAFRTAKQMHVKIAIATLSNSKEQFLSSMQLLEVASMISGSEEKAKEMVQRLQVFL